MRGNIGLLKNGTDLLLMATFMGGGEAGKGRLVRGASPGSIAIQNPDPPITRARKSR